MEEIFSFRPVIVDALIVLPIARVKMSAYVGVLVEDVQIRQL